MTGIYHEEVRPFGVQASQVSLLATIAALMGGAGRTAVMGLFNKVQEAVRP
jgi:hypothetical protein